MSEFRDLQSSQADDFEDVVNAILKSGEFVVPSDDLRPRVLEAAREQCGQKHELRRLSLVASAILLVWLVALPTTRALSELRTHLVAPLPADMLRLADELANRHRYGPDWGLVDAFENTRSLRIQDASSDAND